uniref:Myosin light chain kinase family member 4 n=1 Tax=Paramormyrops kingsleyae TaxID=1676925 RepID=A0A3B3S8Z5_9TELE|nr:myosin light chain kinase 2, skeletal/cardiac muscle-like isoform X1 [Paramormyrops kingsleyae]
MSLPLVNSLAKVYDPNPLQGHKPPLAKTAMESEKPQVQSQNLIETWIKSLSEKMDWLLKVQEKVLHRLDGMSQDIGGIEKEVETLKVVKEEVCQQEKTETESPSDVKEMCQEITNIMSTVNQRTEQQTRKLEGVEKLVLGLQQVIGFLGAKTSKLSEVICIGKVSQTSSAKGKNTVNTKAKHAVRKPQSSNKRANKLKAQKSKDAKEKSSPSLNGLKTQKKKKPPDAGDTISLKKKALLLEEIQKLNQQNAEQSVRPATPELQDAEGSDCLPGLIPSIPQPSVDRSEESSALSSSEEEQDEEEKATQLEDSLIVNEERENEEHFTESEHEEEVEDEEEDAEEALEEDEGTEYELQREETEITDKHLPLPAALPLESHEAPEAGPKRRVTAGVLGEEEAHKKSRVEETSKSPEPVEDEVEPEEQKEDEEKDGEALLEEYIIDCSPPPPAPFDHRIVSAKHNQISNFYTVNREEILGGGRFGQVHKCVENSSGLTLAAKIIKARTQKEKEVVKNEIQVMNQLSHANLIQLYAAYESRHDIILVMEYVAGGELFDRIIDENYNLTELDTVLFIRQISEGLQYMHQRYILHLDLKPENILCVSRETNKIKIIDFGLARRYKPREKLRINFGTPEFLAPEVINYEFVSFPTDTWSLGVITYMLLSGLSPFLGEDDNETLNNILSCKWTFEDEEFMDISDEAKDFITRLLVKSKSWRMSAAEALKHPWLSDRRLHYHLHKKKNKCHSSHTPSGNS